MCLLSHTFHQPPPLPPEKIVISLFACLFSYSFPTFPLLFSVRQGATFLRLPWTIFMVDLANWRHWRPGQEEKNWCNWETIPAAATPPLRLPPHTSPRDSRSCQLTPPCFCPDGSGFWILGSGNTIVTSFPSCLASPKGGKSFLLLLMPGLPHWTYLFCLVSHRLLNKSPLLNSLYWK